MAIKAYQAGEGGLVEAGAHRHAHDEPGGNHRPQALGGAEHAQPEGKQQTGAGQDHTAAVAVDRQSVHGPINADATRAAENAA